MNAIASRKHQAHRLSRLQLLLAGIVVVMAATLALALAPKTALADDDTFIIEEYSLFSPSQKSTLEAQAKETSDTYGVGVYLLVTDTIGSKTARTYAIDYYKDHQLGLGNQKSGILFLVAAESRDYVTITYGDGVNAFTDWQIAQMEDLIVDELKNDEWYAAADVYLEQAEYTLAFRAENGEPLDRGNAPTSPLMAFVMFAIAFAIAAGVAGGRCFYLYKQMKTAVEASHAGDYVDRSSFTLTGKDDRFVTSTITVTPKKKESSSSSGSSTDSSGFGGSSGGKF